MAESRSPSKARDPKQITIRGRLHVKESRRPAPELLVQAFWVDPAKLKGAIRPWVEYLEKEEVVRFAGDVISSASGGFAVPLDMKNVLGERPAIGLVILAPDDDELPEEQQPLYISPRPSAIASRRTFLLAIPGERLEKAGQLPLKPPTATEILDRAEEREQEITSWLRADQRKRDDSIKKITAQSSRAFKHFRPSIVPKSVREHDNYLEDRGKLTETLAKVRSKNLKQLADSQGAKKREVTLSREQAEELGLSEGDKMVEVSLSELTRVLDSAPRSGETAIQYRLLATKARQQREQGIVETLYDYFLQMDEEQGVG